MKAIFRGSGHNIVVEGSPEEISAFAKNFVNKSDVPLRTTNPDTYPSKLDFEAILKKQPDLKTKNLAHVLKFAFQKECPPSNSLDWARVNARLTRAKSAIEQYEFEVIYDVISQLEKKAEAADINEVVRGAAAQGISEQIVREEIQSLLEHNFLSTPKEGFVKHVKSK